MKQKTKWGRFSAMLFAMAFLFSAAGFAQAQSTQQPPVQDIVIKVSGASSYDEATMEITVPVQVTNNTNRFFDNIYYDLALYKGDALKKEGLLFDGLKHMGDGVVKLGSIGPKEDKLYSFKYKHPAGIPSGKYFIKVFLNGEDGDTYAADYTKEPIELKGTGAFLGSFSCVFRADGVNYYAGVGEPLDSTVSPETVMIFGNNPIAEKIKNGKYYIQSSVFEREITGNPVGKSEKKIASVVQDGETMSSVWDDSKIKSNIVTTKLVKSDIGLVVKDQLNAGMKPGTYRVVSVLTDEQGNEASAPCYFRWVVKGASGRILEFKTEKNQYKKGEKYDLTVKVAGSADDSSTGATLLAELFDAKGGKVFELSKKLELGVKIAEADFSDFTFNSESVAKRLVLKLKGPNGEIFDEKEFEYKEVNAVADKKEAIKEGSSESLISVRNTSFVVAALLFLAVLFYLFFKNRAGKNLMLLVILLSVAFFAGTGVAQADCYPGGLWSSISDVSTSCGSWSGYTSFGAGNCINQTYGHLYVNGQYTGFCGAGGHDLSVKCGPFSSGNGTTSFGANFYVWGNAKGDLDGCYSEASHSSSATCNAAPVAVIASPVDGSKFYSSDIVSYSNAGSYDPDGDSVTYSWKLDGVQVSTANTFTLPAGDAQTATHSILLTATDEHGATGTDTHTFSVLGVPSCSVVLSPSVSPIDGPTTTKLRLVTESYDADGVIEYSCSGPGGIPSGSKTLTPWSPKIDNKDLSSNHTANEGAKFVCTATVKNNLGTVTCNTPEFCVRRYDTPNNYRDNESVTCDDVCGGTIFKKAHCQMDDSNCTPVAHKTVACPPSFHDETVPCGACNYKETN